MDPSAVHVHEKGDQIMEDPCLAAVRWMMQRKEKLREKDRRKKEREQRKIDKERRKMQKEQRKTEWERRNLENKQHKDDLRLNGLPDWTKIPILALSIVFGKLGAAVYCSSAQAVCQSWRRLPFTSPLPPCIDMRSLSTARHYLDLGQRAQRAVDCTRGPIEQLHVKRVSETFLTQLADRTHRLRCCSLIGCSISTNVLIDFLRHCPMLEELNIYQGTFLVEIYLHIGKACPNLERLSIDVSYNKETEIGDSDCEYRTRKKLMKWDGVFSDSASSETDSEEDPDPVSNPEGYPSLGDWRALYIAEKVSQLRELRIRMDLTLTNKGVHMIVDRCLNLECLELRCCYNVRVDTALHVKLQKIKMVKLSRRSVLVLNKRLGKQLYV